MEAVSKLVQLTVAQVQLNITEAEMQQVLTKLFDVGVSSPADLCHVVEQDLIPPLRPIQVRKLLAAWAKKSGKCYAALMFGFLLPFVNIMLYCCMWLCYSRHFIQG